MEKFVNDVVFKLNDKLSIEQIEVVKSVLYLTLQDYDLSQKCYDVAIPENDLPKEAKIFLVSRKVDGLKDGSLKQYKRTITKFFETVNKSITEIKTEDCRLFFYLLQTNSKMGLRSLENQRTYLNAFFSWLTDNEYIPRNPVKPITPFKYPKKEKKELTHMEMARLRKACKNDYERAIVEVLYSTACRVSELVDIRLDDIDFDTGDVTIRHGKGDKERTSILGSEAKLAVQDYIKNRNYETIWLFESCRKPHGQLSKRAIQRKTKSMEQRTGIKIHPHKFRRTTATHLIEKGMPVEEVQIFLGHNSIETTMKYVNVNKGKVKADHQKYLS